MRAIWCATYTLDHKLDERKYPIKLIIYFNYAIFLALKEIISVLRSVKLKRIHVPACIMFSISFYVNTVINSFPFFIFILERKWKTIVPMENFYILYWIEYIIINAWLGFTLQHDCLKIPLLRRAFRVGHVCFIGTTMKRLEQTFVRTKLSYRFPTCNFRLFWIAN